MEKKKLITALMICCMAVLPASAEIVNDDIINQTITGQSSASSGGVAHNEIGNTMTIKNSTFTGNNGAYTGGVWNQGELIITDGKETEHTTFDGNSNNSSWGGGGAIYSYEAGSSVYVGDYTSFTGNHSNNDQGGDAGGAIYMGDSTLKIGDYVNMSANQAMSDSNGMGGAMYIQNSNVTTGEHFTANNNESYWSGGALKIWNYDGTSTTQIGIDSEFKNNISHNSSGGAISMNDSTVTIGENAYFENNSAVNGGAVANQINSTAVSDLIIKDGAQFVENKADSNGGAVYNMGTKTEISNAIFRGNEAGNEGGAIYNTTELSVNGAAFTDNSAATGGALYNAENASAALTNVTVNAGPGNSSNSIYNAGSVTTSTTGNYTNTFNSETTNNGEWKFGGNNHVGGNILGSGKITNSGNTTFAGNNESFSGSFTQEASAVTTIQGTFFGGDKEYKIENGTLNWETDKALAEGTTLNISGGNLNVGGSGEGAKTGNLIIGSGSIILDAVETTVNEGSTLTVSGGNVSIGSDDSWLGDIALEDGILNLTGITTGALNATGGELVLDNVSLGAGTVIGEKAAVTTNAGAGPLTISEDIAFTYSDKDNINSEIILDGGTLNYAVEEGSKNADITAKTGYLNIYDGSSLIVAQPSSIADDVVVDIRDGATLTVDDGAVFNLNGITGDQLNSDKWNGMVINDGGEVNASNISNAVTSGLTQQSGTTNITNNSNITLGDSTSSVKGGVINVTNNSILTAVDASIIQGGDINIDSTSTFTSNGGGFIANNLAGSGVFDVQNGSIDSHQASVLNVGDANDSQLDFSFDVYGRSNNNNSSDKFVFDTIKDATGGGATINISNWGLGGDIYGWDAPIDKHIELGNIFAYNTLEGNVEFNSTKKEIHTPIGYYKLNNIGGLNGNYTLDLSRYDGKVFRGQVSTVAQWMNQLAIDDMLFTHSMVLPSFKEEDGGTASSGVMANRYAATSPMFAPYQYSRKDGGLWYKMYGNFESLQMNNGLKVGNNSYGALIGADFGLKELKHGWKFMPTAYIGYNGAHQTFANMGAYQNGGQAGFLGTFYKNNFIIGGLVYGGVYDNSMDVAGHTENTFNYFAGAATKAAYNIRLHRDWVLQPNIMAAYNFFGQQNWHTDYGQMGMMAGMLHGVNIAPGVNLIWEKDTFSAYLTLQYMYNVNGAVGGRAGNVSLPHMEMERGYIQYGIGFTKRFTDRASGYLQAVLRNVGRTGAGFQLGFNYFIGK